MPRTTDLALSRIVREQIDHPSPIRQIMKMAERRNIIEMGLDPDDVISFGGGWVNHEAPEAFRRQYEAIAADPVLFHRSGAYTATLGDNECREQMAAFERHLFGVERLTLENIAIGAGSTQLTHDFFRTVLDPGDTVLLLDPTYANYAGQIAFAVNGARIVRVPVLDPDRWAYLPETDPQRVIEVIDEAFRVHQPRLALFCAPDNPTSQIVPQVVVDALLARTQAAGAWLAIDFAYKCQYFRTPPAYYGWSPEDYPNVVAIHSNSKWARGLGRRLGWIEASRPLIDAIERVQQCSLLCADTLEQMAMARYLREAIADGSLRRYIDETNVRYRRAADATLAAIDTHLGRPRLVPAGALYTVMDVGMDGDEFVRQALKATGVLVIPGRGFGETLRRGVRISYGPLVSDLGKIEEGMGRLGAWMKTR
ncbi:MAG: pyridoxal phosphate-dependent aminotransferase [Acidobacteriota bacterium]|nr:pyridoxal phosphate-dependent aminotransferase [Acidobacteriota bacterium]